MKNKPTLIRRGNVSVKIYRGKTISDGKVYPQYSLVYQDGGQRVRRRFGDLEAAKTEGELVATRLANGDHQLIKLTSADQAVYVQESRSESTTLG